MRFLDFSAPPPPTKDAVDAFADLFNGPNLPQRDFKPQKQTEKPRRDRIKLRAGFEGLYADMPAEDYHADPCHVPSLSASMAITIDQESLAHAWRDHPRLGNKRRDEPTEAMFIGTVLHSLLLGDAPERLEILNVENFKTKPAQLLRDEARSNGLVPITRKRYDRFVEDAATIREAMRAQGVELDPDGQSECSIFWTAKATDGTPVPCRGRMDHFTSSGLIIDLKKIVSASPDTCRRHIDLYGYAIQRAAYVQAIETVMPHLRGRTNFLFVFFEADGTAVTPVKLDGVWREVGARRWQRAVDMWAEAMRSGKWPGFVDGEVTLDPPGWLLAKEERRAAEEELRGEDDEDAADAAE